MNKHESIWHNAIKNPPSGTPGKWSRAVVAVTNICNVYRLSYYHAENRYEGKPEKEGIWQRLSNFEDDEIVVLWTEIPKFTKQTK